ncbi:MAG: hypothetical protein FWG70_01225 [Oscillospiraceae bacterium]|nr:hypothetical protein [Oscillospiraceae bacterium]
MEEIKSTDSIRKTVKPDNGVILFRVITAALITIALIILKVFFPEIYTVINSWLAEKYNFPFSISFIEL